MLGKDVQRWFRNLSHYMELWRSYVWLRLTYNKSERNKKDQIRHRIYEFINFINEDVQVESVELFSYVTKSDQYEVKTKQQRKCFL